MGLQKKWYGGYISIQKGNLFSAQKIVFLPKAPEYKTPSRETERDQAQQAQGCDSVQTERKNIPRERN